MTITLSSVNTKAFQSNPMTITLSSVTLSSLNTKAINTKAIQDHRHCACISAYLLPNVRR